MVSMSSVREATTSRLESISERKFEEFCKILVNEIEQPPHIELTPFHGDGGIDVRGHLGTDILNVRFGIQAKKYKSNVGSPDLQKFVGAIHEHRYQVGLFITTSGFSSGAVRVASRSNNQPIHLVDLDDILDKMIAYEVGIKSDGLGGANIDPNFWAIFEDEDDIGVVSSELVPQADTLDVLRHALCAIDAGHRYKPEIRDYMSRKTRDDWAPRQADYFASAGYSLGYVHKDTIGEYEGKKMRRWGLTRAGQEYVELLERGDREHADSHLALHMRNMAIVEPILQEMKKRGRISHSDMKQIIFDESELNQTTADRRASTVGNWLTNLPEVNRKKQRRSYCYEYVG